MSIIVCFVYWRELFTEKVALGDIKGLYELKKLPSSCSGYLTPWSVGNNPVVPIRALRKASKHG